MSRSISILFAVLVTFAGLLAQEPARPAEAPKSDNPPPNQINGGVLNGKAISLPRPAFPPAARAVGADGPVTVQVLIDENGDVSSATAITGHPLLRSVAVEAAKGAKFTPTFLSGHPVKVAGVITYNFVGPVFPARMGYSLTLAERTGLFDSNTNADYLASSLNPEWSREKEILSGLIFENPVPVKPAAPPPVAMDAAKSGNRYTIMGSASASTSPRKLDSRSVNALREVMTLLADRYSVSELDGWNFELGRAIGVLVAELDDPARLSANVSKIEGVIARAPEKVRPTSLQALREFVALAQSPATDVDDLRIRAQTLARLRY